MNQVDIAKSISGHKFHEAYDSFDNAITWNLIGGQQLQGKDAVIAECQNSADYLAKVETTFEKFEVAAADDIVIIESRAQYNDAGEASTVASCDIYRFKGTYLQEITSYNIELT